MATNSNRHHALCLGRVQVLTNDILKAPLHRVRSPHNLGRYSAPFFFIPRADAVIAPLPAFVTAETPAVYKPIPWREFRELRFAGGPVLNPQCCNLETLQC